MMLQIYDTLSREKKPFKPNNFGHVSLYVCGMTVYDFCHLGHAKMFVSFDVVQRWLRQLGLNVNYVRNITDIDDKIIEKSALLGIGIKEVSDFYTDAMHADERALSVEPPTSEPRATHYIPDMLEIISRLEERGVAYRTIDGDMNYSVRSFPTYGKLSGRKVDDLITTEGTQSKFKNDPLDFALWKSAKSEEPSDAKWESPYGPGRPGWHIECSAMGKAVLGLPFDIHGGGPDLKFPHHENEIAQTEAAFDSHMANTWMHCGPLMVDSDKMSKSLRNFLTIRECVATDHPASGDSNYLVNPREAEMLRFFIVRSHYRTAQNYSQSNLIDAQNALDRLYQTLWAVPPQHQEIDWSTKWAKAFSLAMNDDFNSAAAIAVLFEMSTEINQTRSLDDSGQLRALGGVLGLLQQHPVSYFHTRSRYTNAVNAETVAESVIEFLIDERSKAKHARNFDEADRIRAQLAKHGVEVIDLSDGSFQWRYF